MMKLSTFLLVGLLCANHAHAVNKCTGANGKISFQDAPCAGQGGEIKVTPASGIGQCQGVACADKLSASIKADIEGMERAAKIKVKDIPPVESVVLANKASCEKAIKQRLKDPESVRFGHVSRVGALMGYRDGQMFRFVRYIAGVNAKNSYGGYVGETNWQCSFDADESVLMSVSQGGEYR